MTTVILTEASTALFLEFARDADNWNGQPLVGGNVTITKEERGNLTQLKRAGLVTTFVEEGNTRLDFTDAGKALAATHSIKI